MTPAPARRRIRPDQWTFLQEALCATAAIDAADRLGLLARLDAGPADPAAIARECAIGEGTTHLLLAALAALGVIEATPDGHYQSALPDPIAIADLRSLWRRLPEAIRAGHSAGRPGSGDESGSDELSAGSADPWPATDTGAWLAPVAEAAAGALAGAGSAILDASAGSAVWSLAIARRDAACRVTAVDLPPALEATRRAVEAAGLGSRYRYLPGDPNRIDLGRAVYDLAIVGNLCHLFDAGANRRLLRRIFGALRPGGRLAILDLLAHDRQASARSAVVQAMGLLWRSRSGRVYPFSTYVGWLRDAGFEAIDRIDLFPAAPVSLITAHRPIAD